MPDYCFPEYGFATYWSTNYWLSNKWFTYCPETIGSQIISSQTNGSHTLLVHTSSSFPMIGHKLLDLKLFVDELCSVFRVISSHTTAVAAQRNSSQKVVHKLLTEKLTFNHIHKLHISPL
jgi:hypothetical protein